MSKQIKKKEKEYVKKIIAIVLSVFIVFTTIQITSFSSFAGSIPTDYTTATFDKAYNVTFSSSKSINYFKLDVPSQGILSINATKPGKYPSYKSMGFCLYDSDFNKIWENNTTKVTSNYKDEIDLSVGVKKGTYYVSVKCIAYSAGTNIIFKLINNSNSEIEPNNNENEANTINMDTEYTGYLGGDGSLEDDYWKVYLEKGETYEFKINNYIWIDDKIGRVLLKYPSGQGYNLTDALDYDGSLKITAEETGNCYFIFDLNAGEQFEYKISITKYSYSLVFNKKIIYTYLGDSFHLDYNVKTVGFHGITLESYLIDPNGAIVDKDNRTGYNGNSYLILRVNRDALTGDYKAVIYHKPQEITAENNKIELTVKVYATKEEALAAEQNANNAGKYSNEWINGKWYNADGTQTYAGTLQWKNNATGWWVEDTSGWYPVNQWQKIDGTWYFFKPDGYMAASEYYNGYWFNADGSWDDKYLLSWKSNSTGWWVEDISGWWPSSSWLKIDGYWYYFDASGYMVSNCYIDGWWIGADGVCY